jgi:hypothetical protein
MTVKELAIAVAEMRDLQQRYFATRNRELLSRSKAKEKEIDRMVAGILAGESSEI